MQTRRLGRTDHESTLAIFGAVALDGLSQTEADQFMERVIATGINHIDVAPSYGNAEERLGPTLATESDRFFLGCKTAKRTKEEASEELQRSLELLRVNAFDLYQLHAVTTMEELDQVTGPGGLHWHHGAWDGSPGGFPGSVEAF
jgi:aryl-alcohol dehydrogenase-like predicted oxidoreductase